MSRSDVAIRPHLVVEMAGKGARPPCAQPHPRPIDDQDPMH